MKRHYYISDDLNDLEKLEIELEKAGVDVEQIHCLSNDDAYLETHHLHAVDSISKKDVVRSGLIGLLIGLAGAAAILFLSSHFGISENFTWAPALFLSIAFLGFCLFVLTIFFFLLPVSSLHQSLLDCYFLQFHLLLL